MSSVRTLVTFKRCLDWVVFLQINSEIYDVVWEEREKREDCPVSKNVPCVRGTFLERKYQRTLCLSWLTSVMFRLSCLLQINSETTGYGLESMSGVRSLVTFNWSIWSRQTKREESSVSKNVPKREELLCQRTSLSHFLERKYQRTFRLSWSIPVMFRLSCLLQINSETTCIHGKIDRIEINHDPKVACNHGGDGWRTMRMFEEAHCDE